MSDEPAPREPWPKYVLRVCDGLSADEVAAKTGISASTIRRWFRGDVDARADLAISFARGLNARPAEALMYAGYLDPADIEGTFEVVRSPSEWSDDELLAELAGRLAERPARRKIDNYGSTLSPPDDGLESGEDESGLV